MPRHDARQPQWSHEISLGRELMGVLASALAIALALSFLNFAGSVGGRIGEGFFTSVGVFRWIAPIVLLRASVFAWFPRRFVLRIFEVTGVALLLVGSVLFVSLLAPLDAGSLGQFVIERIVAGFGRPLSWLLAIILFGTGLSLLTRFPLFALLFRKLAWAFRWLSGYGARALALLFTWRRRPARDAAVSEEEPDTEDASPESGVFLERAITGDGEAVSAPVMATHRPRRIARKGTFTPTFTLQLLDSMTAEAKPGDIALVQKTIADTFENFGIGVEMAEVAVGPTVTQYTLKPATGVKVSQIMALQNDLALSLAAHPIRIEAPIPGRALVGIEVPNQSKALVGLRELLGAPQFLDGVRANPNSLLLALGKDVAGMPYTARLEKMPHLLIAGATGSGKTVAINSVLTSLLYQKQPHELKLLLIDPKRVELPAYNGIPHLIAPVVTDLKKTVSALKWVIREMDRRFNVLAAAGRRDIGSYNEVSEDQMPYLVVVIDELADLMMTSASDVEASIIRIAQMARAVGIHLIVATQRPSVDVLTGLIKANVTTRLAFAVASSVDSRTILDTAGAEKLLGRGDCLFASAELSKPKRLQGAFVSEGETERIVRAIKELGVPEYEDVSPAGHEADEATRPTFDDEGGGEEEPLLDEAIVVIQQAGRASASLLQRRLKVGYARAARMLDILEDRGVVGPGEGAKPRDVLIASAENGIVEQSGASEIADVDNESEEESSGP